MNHSRFFSIIDILSLRDMLIYKPRKSKAIVKQLLAHAALPLLLLLLLLSLSLLLLLLLLYYCLLLLITILTIIAVGISLIMFIAIMTHNCDHAGHYRFSVRIIGNLSPHGTRTVPPGQLLQKQFGIPRVSTARFRYETLLSIKIPTIRDYKI